MLRELISNFDLMSQQDSSTQTIDKHGETQDVDAEQLRKIIGYNSSDNTNLRILAEAIYR